ncbi:lycopene beta-cyclase CrtY [Allosphingosinicella indica]|uniref:Lycopene beta-cyclase n=1 Tax=Allosphingosinicella indica TaxID=941907 RepID=A0A1X7G7X8_9SPHN|nr:lycopene beta-cyclase CrtY [Allosphingosinicella indica]SMF65604.1 lycopene beta-cyclase [Allosphingosinicella indica]
MPRGKREGLLIAGGGLAGSLAALAMAKHRPDVPILLVEEGPAFGGSHVWSFFRSDIEEANWGLIEPLIVHCWPGYYVAFPGHSRKLKSEYCSARSEQLHAEVLEVLRPDQYRLNTKIVAVRENELVLAGGEKIRADGAIDARGAAHLTHLDLGWQKFVGREYRFAKPHGVDRPVIMDATVDQTDGYRFVYCLPFAEDRMLVEDTYYSESPSLDMEGIGARIDAYCALRGWQIAEQEREESGVLPVAMGGDFSGFWRAGGARVAKLGLRAGLFHPTTGYTFPDAVRAAMFLTRQKDFSGGALHDAFEGYASQTWKRREFYRTLDKMLFRAAEPHERYKVLERFYRLDPKLIARFYAAQSTTFDKMRILAGKPPVPIGRAVSALKKG